jgi:hypothetical protein
MSDTVHLARLRCELRRLGIPFDKDATADELEFLLAEASAVPSSADWTRPALTWLWRVLKIGAAIVACMGAISFASFIWEETLQCQGFSVKGAIDARDSTVAAACLKRLCSMQAAAASWQHAFGWLSPWMHASYTAYFRATESQIASYYVQGVKLGLWCEDEGRVIVDGVDPWTIDNAIEHAHLAADHPSRDCIHWLVTQPIDTQAVTRVVITPQQPRPTAVDTQIVTRVSVGIPDAAFWRKWREDPDAMRELGYSLSKTTNGWRVTRTH